MDYGTQQRHLIMFCIINSDQIKSGAGTDVNAERTAGKRLKSLFTKRAIVEKYMPVGGT